MAGAQEVRNAIAQVLANVKTADDAVELLHKKIDEAPTTDISEAFAAEVLSSLATVEEALAKVPTKDVFPMPT